MKKRKLFWSILEVLETVAIAVVAVVVIRSFIAQPFLVSGSSMEPTFQNGDYLLVDELVYDIREPNRGEVVIFRNDTGNGSYFIKRIIGLPGETVVVEGNKVKVTGGGETRVLEEKYTLEDFTPKRYEVKLDADEYFVMGDNRGFSFDSRNWGPLEEDDIVGLARLRLWPVDKAMAIEPPSY